MGTDYIPKLGIEFGFEQEAYGFYNECGGNFGFSIHKGWCNKRKKDGVVTSRKFTVVKREIKPHGPEPASIGLNWPIQLESIGFGRPI